MLTPADFPRLRLCDPCSRLFTDYKDESIDPYNSIQFHIWYEKGGYVYTRTRRELERAAVFGCVFCKAVISRDGKYKEDPSKYEIEVCFDEPRPAWYPPLHEKVELAIRYNWVDNVLYIWSRRGVQWGGGDLSWSLYATSTDPSASIVHSQAVLTELGSSESFAEARKWMNECLTNHTMCSANIPVHLPTRVVQVSALGEPLFARLCETNGQKGSYTALSYCWGGDQEHKTLRKNYDQYKKELPYCDLPKTITDAFQVIRSMGQQYIWIDSLCILQDDSEDKENEMAKMMDIYQNTQFTISAASASDVTQGFLQTKLEESSIGAFYHPLRINEHTMGSVLISDSSSSFATVGAHQQPINKRGWTFQEALLTPRLLIFTNFHMVWKCKTGYQPHFHATSRDSREDPEGSDWHSWSSLCGYSFTSLENLREAPTPQAPKTGQRFDSCEGIYSTWHFILASYIKRSLTVENDRLPAISAIARAFSSYFKSEYYAGLWGRFLVHDLMWENRSSNPSLAKSGCPSWSWAKINGEHSYDHGNNDYAIAEVISCKTTLVSDNNPFGEVTSGELVIRGRLKEVWLNQEEGLFLNENRCVISDAKFISDRGSGDWEKSPVSCLLLGGKPGGAIHSNYPNCCQSGECKNIKSVQCQLMVIIESPDQEGCYQRIGLAKTSRQYRPYWWEECDEVTLTII